jgi:hypothetical protein
MLRALLRLLGVDLNQKLAEIRDQISGLKRSAISQATRQAKKTGLTVGLALLGATAALFTFLISLAVLYVWVDMYEGPLVALAVLGLVTASLATLMFVLAFRRARRKPVAVPLSFNPAASASSSPSEPAFLSAALPPPPPNASLVDILTHRFSTRVAAASDEAIDAAVHAMRTSSRPALFGTLAVVALMGMLIGRRR